MKNRFISLLKVAAFVLCALITLNSCAGYANESNMKESTKDVLIQTISNLEKLDKKCPSITEFKNQMRSALKSVNQDYEVSEDFKNILATYIDEDLDFINSKTVITAIKYINEELNKKSEITIPQKKIEDKVTQITTHPKYPYCKFILGFEESHDKEGSVILAENEFKILYKKDSIFVIIGPLISCIAIVAEGVYGSFLYHLYFDGVQNAKGKYIEALIKKNLNTLLKLTVYCNQTNEGGSKTTNNQNRFIEEIKTIYQKSLSHNLVIVKNDHSRFDVKDFENHKEGNFFEKLKVIDKLQGKMQAAEENRLKAFLPERYIRVSYRGDQGNGELSVRNTIPVELKK